MEASWVVEALVIHAVYLLNCASEDPEIRSKSLEALKVALNAGAQLGALGVVLHPGSALKDGGPVDAALERAGEVIKEALAESETCKLLLEDTAGAGGTLGRSFEELATLVELGGGGDRLGNCLDSCHLFASGYDVRTAESLRAVIDEFDKVVGCDRLGALHVNDSMTELGSNRDRHVNLGDGEIGVEGMIAFLSEPRFEGLPVIFGGPGRTGKGIEAKDMAWAYDLRSRGLAARLRDRLPPVCATCRTRRRDGELAGASPSGRCGTQVTPRIRATTRRMHDHDRGLAFDLPRLISRRRALGVLLGGLGSAVVARVRRRIRRPDRATRQPPAAPAATRSPRRPPGPTPATAPTARTCSPRAASSASDITTSFGDASGVAEGVPTTIDLTLLDVAGGGGPLAGAAVYVWHCDRDGPLLALRRVDRGRELPARRAGGRRGRHADVQDDLPGRLLGPLAAHALRGLREPRRRHRGPGASCAPRSSRSRRTPASRCTRRPATSRACRTSPDVAGHRHGLQRRLQAPAREP